MKTTPFPRKESMFAVLDALAESQGTSETPPLEPAGPAKVVAAVSTGSWSVSSERLLQASCTLEIVADDDVSPGTKRQIKEIAYLLRCRADAARESERQPTPNTQGSATREARSL